MFINWLLTVFPVEMRGGWHLVSRNLVLWVAVAAFSALLTALADSMHGQAPPTLTILQGLLPVLVTFLAVAKFDAAARNAESEWGKLGILLLLRGLPLLGCAILATLITRVPQSLVYHLTAALLGGTPLQHAISEVFSIVIYISLLARFCFIPFLVVLQRRGDLNDTVLPRGRLNLPAALVWPFVASDKMTDGVRWRVAPYLALPYLTAIAISLVPGIAQGLILVLGEILKLVASAVLYRYYAAQRVVAVRAD
jgi:hypothetical protein